MRYILHYTNPGDVIFDGFCGSGMTGVAAQLCSDPNTIKSLGYKVDGSGLIFEETADGAMKRISQLGFRKTILADISPAATFISHNYNKKSDVLKFQRNATSLLKSLIRDFQWAFVTFADLETKMYDQLSSRLQTATKLDDLKEILEPYKSSLGQINYVVWSDVFTCSNCSRDVVYWEAAVDRETKAVSKEFECFHCGASLASRTEDRAWTYYHDRATGQSRK